MDIRLKIDEVKDWLSEKGILFIRNYRDVTPEDRVFFLEELRKYPMLDFIGDLDLAKISFYWCKDMNTQNGILGAFSPWRPNKIFLMDMSSVRILLFPTVVHELRHMWQRKKYGWLLYMFLSFYLWRNYTLERSAKKYEVIAENINRARECLRKGAKSHKNIRIIDPLGI